MTSSFLCGDCYLDLNNSKSYEAHLQSPQHLSQKNLRAEFAKNSSDLCCQVCCIVTNSKEIMNNHLCGKEHKKRLTVKNALEESPTEQSPTVPSVSKFTLDPSESFQRLLLSLERHLNEIDSPEEAQLPASPTEQQPLTPPTSTSVKRSNSHMAQHPDDGFTPPSKQPLEKPTQSGNFFTCNICNCQMNSLITLEAHMNGEKHLKKSRSGMISAFQSTYDLQSVSQTEGIKSSMTISSFPTMLSTDNLVDSPSGTQSRMVPSATLRPSSSLIGISAASQSHRKIVESIKRELERLDDNEEQSIPKKAFREVDVDPSAKMSNVSFFVYKSSDADQQKRSPSAGILPSPSKASFHISSSKSSLENSFDAEELNCTSSSSVSSHEIKWNAFLESSRKIKSIFEDQSAKKLAEKYANNSTCPDTVPVVA